MAHWKRHCTRAAGFPRSSSWWASTVCICPKTGSTIALRRAWVACPCLVFSLRAMRCLPSLGGTGSGPTWLLAESNYILLGGCKRG